jgi:hypothetical protein
MLSRARRSILGIERPPDPGPLTQVGQRLLFEHHRSQVDQIHPAPLGPGFRVYSQSDEDGVLLQLLARIGLGDRRCIELGLGSPMGSNTTNLLVNWGFDGLLVDGSPSAVEDADRWFREQPDTSVDPPLVLHRWISPENIDDLVEGAGWAGRSVDVLSIDIDGADYWVWQALSCIEPRIVAVEIADAWPPDVSITVPDDPAFHADRQLDESFASASLRAMTTLAQTKSYALVGVSRSGFNAFYVHDSVRSDLPEVTVESCAHQPRTVKVRNQRIALMDRNRWVDV